MGSFKLAALACILAGFTLVSYPQHHHVSGENLTEASSENPKLIDEFGKLGHCDLTARYDSFFVELSENPKSRGYVIVYQGADALPADYNNPPAERMFVNHIGFRRFDATRVTVMKGGFRKEGVTQLWVVPPGVAPPTPTDTVPDPEIPTKETFLFDRKYLDLGEDDYSGSEYLLASVKAKREAERKQSEEEYRLERLAAGEDPDPEPNSEEINDEVAEFDDDLTPEEKENQKFGWLSEAFGKLLKTRDDSKGLVIFYLDDKEFEVGKVRSLIDEGIAKINKSAEMKESRISVVFGGYRNITDIEFWVVPKNGDISKPKPDERPVEDAENEQA